MYEQRSSSNKNQEPSGDRFATPQGGSANYTHLRGVSVELAAEVFLGFLASDVRGMLAASGDSPIVRRFLEAASARLMNMPKAPSSPRISAVHVIHALRQAQNDTPVKQGISITFFTPKRRDVQALENDPRLMDDSISAEYQEFLTDPDRWSFALQVTRATAESDKMLFTVLGCDEVGSRQVLSARNTAVILPEGSPYATEAGTDQAQQLCKRVTENLGYTPHAVTADNTVATAIVRELETHSTLFGYETDARYFQG